LEQGDKRRLTSTRGSGADVWPALSPDGRWLAYGSCRGPWTCDVEALPLDAAFQPAGPPRRLTREGFVLFGIAWTSDGRDLVYAASHSGANVPYLWRLAISGGGRPERVDLAGSQGRYPALARAGRRLAFSRGLSDSDIWKIDVPGPPRPVLQSTKIEYFPDLSPDGTRIAFSSDRSSDGLELFISESDGSNPVQLTDRLGREHGAPRWSPDGRWIAFGVQTESGDFDLLVVDAAGGAPRRLAATPHYELRAAWSRDGRFVYFSSDRTGRFEIWRAPVDGGEAKQVTDDGGVTSLESYDGRTLYYVKTHAGPQPLFARTPGAPGERKVVEAILGRDFAVDETGVLYFARGTKPGTISLRHLEPDTGSTREVTTLDVLPTVGFSVSRDGRTIVFAAMKPANDDLYLIENFR
jgi:Tol biopolymer transport system component